MGISPDKIDNILGEYTARAVAAGHSPAEVNALNPTPEKMSQAVSNVEGLTDTVYDVLRVALPRVRAGIEELFNKALNKR